MCVVNSVEVPQNYWNQIAQENVFLIKVLNELARFRLFCLCFNGVILISTVNIREWCVALLNLTIGVSEYLFLYWISIGIYDVLEKKY